MVKRLMNFSRITAYIIGIVLAVSTFIAPASAAPVPAPDIRTYIDQNGVNLLNGESYQATGLLSIGSGADGLSVSFTTRNANGGALHRNSHFGAINHYGGSTYIVSMGNSAEEFTQSGGVYSPKYANGATLTKSGGTYTYTSRSGAVAVFSDAVKSINATGGHEANVAALTSLTSPSGAVLTYKYETEVITSPSATNLHLLSVTNNLGYQLKFSDKGNDVKGINNRVEYCDPVAATCTTTQGPWPTASFEPPTPSTPAEITNPRNEKTTLEPTSYTEPSGVSQDYTYTAVTIGGKIIDRVTSATNAGSTWNYAYSDNGAIRTVTITGPQGGVRTVKSNIANGTVTEETDELGRTTIYEYDTDLRIKKITSPSTTSVEYQYDGRGNVTQTKRNPKTGSSAAAIITTANYPASCANAKTCNKPTWTRDARGKQTDYTYYSTHGGLNTVTGPAPSSGASRPTVTYSYTSLAAKVKNSSGTLVDAAPVWRMSSVSTCSTGGTCAGSANETVISLTYKNTENLNPWVRTVKAGNNVDSTSSTTLFDIFGSPLSVDGPLSGSADKVEYIYDNSRRLEGQIGPDPDGAGPLKHQAVRYTYTNGLPTLTETGTTTGYGSGGWAGFTTLQKSITAYDTHGRPVTKTLQNGSTSYALQQISYDSESRPECVATRMNPSNYSSLPSSACTLGSAGSFGPDRIVKAEYNAAGQRTKTIKGFGTAVAVTEEVSYYSNGNIKSLFDGEGNETRNEYDDFNRPYKTYLPSASGAGYNTADYEQVNYDAFGRATSKRLRDSSVISSVFDDLGRTTMIDAPGTADDISFTYDAFGRVLTTTKDGTTLTNVYDALSRRKSETGPHGTVSYLYDAAGRGTRITYPSGGTSLYVQYDYDALGRVTHVRENGASSGLGVLAAYEYNDQGRRTKMTRGNGAVTNYGYDLAARLISFENDVLNSADDVTLTFTHAPSGQIASRATSNSAYDWDGAGPVSQTYGINGLNQMISAALGSISHDDRGNTTDVGSKDYTYDIYNNLTSAVDTGAGINASMDYDPAGRLASVTGNGTVTKFGYSGTQMIAEYNASGTILKRYVHGAGVDAPIVMYEGTGLTTRKWLMTDQQGSVTAHTNHSGAVTAKNTYNEYGVPDAANTGRFQYTGQMWLAEAKVYHYKARAYDPYLARFLQTDPIGYAAGMNMYAYVNGDPVNLSDPSGLDPDGHNVPIVCPPGTPEGVGCAVRYLSQCAGGFIGGKDGCDFSLLGYMGGAVGSYTGGPRGDSGGDSGTDSGDPVTEEMTEYCNEMRNTLIREYPYDPVGLVKVTEGLDLPAEWTPKYVGPYQHVMGRFGLHDVNYRIPYTGLHFGSEEKAKKTGLYLHHDVYDPTESVAQLFMHGYFEVVTGFTAGFWGTDALKKVYFDDLEKNLACFGFEGG